MGYRPINALVLALVVCVAVFASPTRAAAEDSPNTIQPLALNHAGVHALKQAHPDLTGAGVRIANIARSITYVNGLPQNDYRPTILHNSVKEKSFTFHDYPTLPPGTSAHSTAICSILFGHDPNAFDEDLGPFRYTGIVPQAQADVYEFWYFLIEHVFAQLPPDADVITTSMGGQFEHWWTRGIDALVEQYGLLVVAGIGNGLDAHDPPLYPGASANVIGVGVVDSVNTEDLATSLAHFALAYPEHSSFGPTSTGSAKPDIVAPGNCLAADVNNPENYEPTGNWSSFSTPVVAGTIGLLVQAARQDPNLSPALSVNAGNCAIKAILMSSAEKLPFWHKGKLSKDDDHEVPLDYIQGAGMLNASRAHEQLLAGVAKPGPAPTTAWDLNRLNKTAPENAYTITIPDPAAKTITATAAWNKHYKTVYPFEPDPEKNANLRLEVWAVDPNNSDNDYLLDYSNSPVDNTEHIYCTTDPNYSHYEIVVSYADSDSGNNPPQRYALAWNVADTKDKHSIYWYDLNADGAVDDVDLFVFLQNWAASAEPENCYLIGDMNSDGAIGPDDIDLLFENKDRKADWQP